MDYRKEAEAVFECMCSLHGLRPYKDVSGLSQGEKALLAYLACEHDGASAGELASAFGVGTPRIAAILNAIGRKGLAERRSDPEDGRRVLVYITDRGKEQVLAKRQEAIEDMAMFLESLGEEDAKAFLRIMQKAVALTEQAARDPKRGSCVRERKGDRC